VRSTAVAALREEAERIASARGIELAWATLAETPAVEMTPALRSALADAIASQGLPVRGLVSGAGHDATVLARVCPAAMLFLRCAGGVSHDPRESVAESDVAVALDVLERAVRTT
jgi:acetylornithine deacetylase/succinyl-diaminopimelate desuccinylase-like protein